MRGRQPWRSGRARVLRDSPTSAEEWLWSRLRGRRLNGLKFVRQSPVGPYFVDFLCREHKFVIEVDGATHSSAAETTSDLRRSAFLAAEGYHVFRAQNDDVFHNLEGILETVLALIESDAEHRAKT